MLSVGSISAIRIMATRPFMRGMLTSSTAASKRPVASAASAVWPSPAVVTRCPSSSSSNRTASQIFGSSSTTSTWSLVFALTVAL